jgi:Domain of unknown function (DUF4440)
MNIPDEKWFSRRQVVNGIGLGLATAAATTIPAFSQDAPTQNSTAQAVQNPTTKYPKPPFKEQFNERDLNTMAAIFDKDLEFYHDREGLTNYQHNIDTFDKDLEFYHDREGLTNYQRNIDTFRRHFGEETRVRRELVEGTMEVYPITGYGAVEFCIQRFYTTEKGQAEHLSATSRLVGLWRNEGGKWTLARVISYDHR